MRTATSAGTERFAQYRSAPPLALLAFLAAALSAHTAGLAFAEPKVRETQVLGPFTGPQAKLHPDNTAPYLAEYYGTDLGFSYEHQGQIRFLFGDTTANEKGSAIQASTNGRFDDAIGSVDLARWNQPELFASSNIPLIKLLQNPNSREVAAIDPGHALELFKTPLGGFSNGRQEFGLFFTFKPKGCSRNADCSNGSQCDTGLGVIGSPWQEKEGLTFGCIDGSSPLCNTSTLNDASGKPVADSGLCVDRTSSLYANTPMGRISSLSVKMLIATRDSPTSKTYSTDHVWYSSKFMNPAVRTVRSFSPPETGKTFAPDFRAAQTSGPQARIFIWGRPHFVGVNKAGRTLGLYFAFLDLPAGPGYSWRPHYFAGLDASGLPHFSPSEADAKPIDLDSSKPGTQPAEPYDIVDQNSIAWVPQLAKWVMFFGGGVLDEPLPNLPNCGLLELFSGADCKQVDVGDGAFRMRTADYPWGPWSSAQVLIAPGDPKFAKGQFGPGGMLHHPACKGPSCAPIDIAEERYAEEVGFFYAPNIVEQWTRPSADGVDIIWNASTWAPYRVILLRTHISR